MARCLIGCGSNLGRRREHLDRAIELVRFMPGVSLLGVSRFLETRPIGGPSGQEPFLNGACLIETDLPPHDVLCMLAAVENTLHRERLERWGPRTVDLDLLLYDDVVLETDALTLPHPRMSTRRFVLEPCVEIAADIRHPLAACTLAEMLDSITTPEPHVAVVGVPGSGAREVAAAVAEATLACHVTAPRPLPDADAPLAVWVATLHAWTAALSGAGCEDVSHGMIADYWLDTLRLAAVDALQDADRKRFERECAAVAAASLAPHAVLLLTVADDALAGTPRLAELQRRLVASVRGPRERSPLAPRAVVVIDAGDRARASAEAIAAVEAMV
jgi:2-amino-4-hydroxy-6-hydroxymethyldihydropteridine diphosphokinase